MESFNILLPWHCRFSLAFLAKGKKYWNFEGFGWVKFQVHWEGKAFGVLLMAKIRSEMFEPLTIFFFIYRQIWKALLALARYLIFSSFMPRVFEVQMENGKCQLTENWLKGLQQSVGILFKLYSSITVKRIWIPITKFISAFKALHN